jgi:hypothetical protein
MSRTLAAIVAVAVVVAGLALDACGRKEKLIPPRGADYPRQYPRE